MLKRIKIVTSLLLVLVLFGLLQLTSGGLFFNALKNDKENFTVLQTIRQQQYTLNGSWVALLQTRNTLNRAGIRYMMDQSNIGSGATVAELMQIASASLKQAEKNWADYEALPRDPRQSEAASAEIKRNYDIYHNALAELIQLLGAGKINAFFDQPTQGYQDGFEKQYVNYLQQNDRLYDLAVADNNRSYSQAMWVLGSVLLAVLVVIIAVWFGIKLSLIAPMNRLIASIRHIASGDLVKRIDVEGTNEMGQLAESLRHMQGELVRTVGDVRNGANAIYSGASEIAMGNNDLSSRTEQQAASLEETAASMEELTATVKQNAENARQASHLALSASETAQKGGKVVDNVVQTMRDIASSSQKIADIISVIDGIAFQTNILALNAAGRRLAEYEHHRLRRDADILARWNGEAIPVEPLKATTLNEDDWLTLMGFAFAHRPLLTSLGGLSRLLANSTLSLPALRGSLQARLSDADLCLTLRLSGRKALLKRQREEAAQALIAWDPARTEHDRNRILQWQFFH